MDGGYSCYESSCINGCECYPNQNLFSLYCTFLVFFSLAMSLEVIKGFVVFFTSVFGFSCCNSCTCEGYKCKNCYEHIPDSWALLALYIATPRYYEELKKLEDKGKLVVFSWLKFFQWIFRDITMLVMISLYLNVVGYNPWFFIYVISVAGYWFFLRRRAQYQMFITDEANKSKPAITVQTQVPMVTKTEIESLQLHRKSSELGLQTQPKPPAQSYSSETPLDVNVKEKTEQRRVQLRTLRKELQQKKISKIRSS